MSHEAFETSPSNTTVSHWFRFAPSLLLAFMRHPEADPTKVRFAAQLIAREGLRLRDAQEAREAQEVLLMLTHHPSGIVREDAVDALRNFDVPSVVTRMRELVDSDPSNGVRSSAAACLHGHAENGQKAE